MSGSSRAGVTLDRCVVIIDSGINISWARNPDGTYPGSQYHNKQESHFRDKIKEKSVLIEAELDKREQKGTHFFPTSHADFDKNCKEAKYHYVTEISLLIFTHPELSSTELDNLAKDVAEILLEGKDSI